MPHTTKSDKELVLLLIKNDESAFREFYFRYKDRLWYYAFQFLKSEEESDDIIQEVFIRFWELRSFIDPEQSISSFLYTITKNRVLNNLRNTDVEVQVKKALALQLPSETDSMEANLIFSEYQQILADAIKQLPPQRQRIFNLSRIEYKSHKEIAIQLGISVSTVQEHISESLRFIKSYFSKHTDLTLSILILLLI